MSSSRLVLAADRAEEMTEARFGAATWVTEENGDVRFSEAAQDFYNETLDELEAGGAAQEFRYFEGKVNP